MQLEMNRRQFTTLATAGVAGATGLWSVNSQAAGQFKAGVNYMRLEKPVAVDAAAGQIEVLEFFAYTCIHCYRFVVVRRMPVAFNASMEPLQRLYFALETMNLVEQLHSKVFAAFHQEKLRLLDDTSITAWVGKQGGDMTAFNAAFKGFSAAGRARRASQLADAYGLEGTPALGLAGQFYIPGQGPKTLDVAEELMRGLRT
jgi:thiol:disulfide interchange protein DsbA